MDAETYKRELKRMHDMTHQLAEYGSGIKKLLPGYSSKIIIPTQPGAPIELILSGKDNRPQASEFLEYLCKIIKTELELSNPPYKYKITSTGNNPVLIVSELIYTEEYKKYLEEVGKAENIQNVSESNIFFTPDAFIYESLGNRALNRIKGMIDSYGVNPAEISSVITVPFVVNFENPQNGRALSLKKDFAIRITEHDKVLTTSKILFYLHSLFSPE